MRLWTTLLLILMSTLSAEVFRGHSRHRPPDMVLEGDEFSGPIPEVIETALDRLGHTVEWQSVPWPRSLLAAKEGNVDLLPRHSMNEERTAFLLPIPFAYEHREVYFYIAPGHDSISIRSYEDLRNYEIAVSRDAFFFEEFNNDSTLNKIEKNSYVQIAKMLERGRVKVTICFEGGGLDTISKVSGARRASYVKTFSNGRYFSSPHKSPMAVHYQALHEEIHKMRKSGEIDTIYSKYGLTPLQQYFPDEL